MGGFVSTEGHPHISRKRNKFDQNLIFDIITHLYNLKLLSFNYSSFDG